MAASVATHSLAEPKKAVSPLGTTAERIKNSLNMPRPVLIAGAGRAISVRMAEERAGIVILARRIEREELSRLIDLYFKDMLKIVADLGRSLVAAGGELHADAESLLLQDGSLQADLWGANYYPGRGPDGCIEFTALINIRPAQGNRSMEIQDPEIRERVRALTIALVGEGEAI